MPFSFLRRDRSAQQVRRTAHGYFWIDIPILDCLPLFLSRQKEFRNTIERQRGRQNFLGKVWYCRSYLTAKTSRIWSGLCFFGILFISLILCHKTKNWHINFIRKIARGYNQGRIISLIVFTKILCGNCERVLQLMRKIYLTVSFSRESGTFLLREKYGL